MLPIVIQQNQYYLRAEYGLNIWARTSYMYSKSLNRYVLGNGKLS